MQKNSFKLLALASALATLTFTAACSDDGSADEADASSSGDRDFNRGGGSNSDSDTSSELDAAITPGDDTSTTGPDAAPEPDTSGSDPSEICDVLTTAPTDGNSCTGASADECGPGAACLQLSFDDAPRCYTVCLAELCGNTCDAGATCVTISFKAEDGGEAAPQPVDVNDDGVDDDNLGACVVPPTGDRTAYQECDVDNFCVAGAACIGTEGSEFQFCGPSCDTAADCPTIGSDQPPQCIPLQDSSTGACGVPCSTTQAGATCPDGFTCTSLGTGEVCIQTL